MAKNVSPRVVITGMGAVTPMGIGVDVSWEAAVRGVSGIGPITLFDASELPCRIAGEVPDFDATQFISRREARRMSPVFAVGDGSVSAGGG